MLLPYYYQVGLEAPVPKLASGDSWDGDPSSLLGRGESPGSPLGLLDITPEEA